MVRVGVVAIGRNEGERLKRCLLSLQGASVPIVYVDSGSTDASPEMAESLGAMVVALDMAIPFTAARARNAGLARLLEHCPDLTYVQFVDGDCEVAEHWLDRAVAELDSNPSLAVICGRRRERFPNASVYNRLCDLEWDTPIGDAEACGGDAMIRVGMFREVNGYREDLIAGEEPELCVRLRSRGWGVRRIDAEMTRHDAAMTRFGQWWKRNKRAGHAFAEVSRMHRGSPARIWVRPYWSNWFWGAILLPLAPVVYPLQMVRVYRRRRRAGLDAASARWYALFVILGKVPQMLGQLAYHWDRLRGTRRPLIEYKSTEPTAS